MSRENIAAVAKQMYKSMTGIGKNQPKTPIIIASQYVLPKPARREVIHFTDTYGFPLEDSKPYVVKKRLEECHADVKREPITDGNGFPV